MGTVPILQSTFLVRVTTYCTWPLQKESVIFRVSKSVVYFVVIVLDAHWLAEYTREFMLP